MIKVGDIVRHFRFRSRVGIVIGIDNYAYVVEWFNGDDNSYRYYHHTLVKLSK
jgi:ribosomal protein L21E